MDLLKVLTSQSVTESLNQYNIALDLQQKRYQDNVICDTLFKGLANLQTEWSKIKDGQENKFARERGGGVAAFIEFILSTLKEKECHIILKSKEFRNFVDFTPLILNQKILLRNDYNHKKEIETEIERKASEKHQKLQNAYKRYKDNKTIENQKIVIKKMADLLFIVRSNITQREKTPFSSYLKKWECDEAVSHVIIPLQLRLFDMLLNYPSEKLIVCLPSVSEDAYHKILSDLQGTWQKCIINGSIIKRRDHLVFYPDISDEDIDAQLFTSLRLPKKWKSLDHGGSIYERHLITGKLQNGQLVVANIYLELFCI
jgi:hypothetical protein